MDGNEANLLMFIIVVFQGCERTEEGSQGDEESRSTSQGKTSAKTKDL